MPHQCVRCGNVYASGAAEILKGCSKCTGRFFFFVKQEDLDKVKQLTENLSDEEKKQMEMDVLDIVGDSIDKERPVILDFESIRILKPGKYEIDLVDLFKGKPLIYKLDEGKYVIDIVSTFESKEKEE
ncbi:hypothetical protein HY501_02215 [Candidatus Woesearchaeota archaeon]|nr:hypothetical protein [Candidatus Woesearchaeota archaeon]